MTSLRTVCIVGAAVCGLFFITTKLYSAPLQAPSFSLDDSSSDESLRAIVRDAVADGGTVVHCNGQGNCSDMDSGQALGQARPGYYVVFSTEGKDYEAKLTHYQKRISQWMNNR